MIIFKYNLQRKMRSQKHPERHKRLPNNFLQETNAFVRVLIDQGIGVVEAGGILVCGIDERDVCHGVMLIVQESGGSSSSNVEKVRLGHEL